MMTPSPANLCQASDSESSWGTFFIVAAQRYFLAEALLTHWSELACFGQNNENERAMPIV